MKQDNCKEKGGRLIMVKLIITQEIRSSKTGGNIITVQRRKAVLVRLT